MMGWPAGDRIKTHQQVADLQQKQTQQTILQLLCIIHLFLLKTGHQEA